MGFIYFFAASTMSRKFLKKADKNQREQSQIKILLNDVEIYFIFNNFKKV